MKPNSLKSITPRILVLDSHSNASLAVLQSLGYAGYSTTLAGACFDPISGSSKYARSFLLYPDPLKDKKLFQSWIQDIEEKNSFDFVIPVTDSTIYPLLEMANNNETRYLIPPKNSFEFFFNKKMTLSLAKKLRIPIPETWSITDPDFQINTLTNYPYFIKPIRSKIWIEKKGFNLSAKLVRTKNELTKYILEMKKYGDLIIQEYSGGTGIGVEVLCEKGEVLVFFGHRRVHEYPLTGGGSTYRVSVKVPEILLEYTKELVKSADWNGPAMVEFKENGSNYSLMEVNGRFWGSLPLSIRSGINFPLFYLELVQGKKTNFKQTYKVGLYARRVKSDIQWFKDNLRANKNDRFLLTRPVAKSLLEWMRIFTGKDRWDHAIFSDLGPIISEIKIVFLNEINSIKNKILKSFVLKSAKKKSLKIFKNNIPKNILVVCHGNICRSPFVEHYLKMKLIKEKAYEIKSCGFFPKDDRNTPEDFINIAQKFGIDLSDHRSKVLNNDLINWADCILIMDYKNWNYFGLNFYKARNKIVWLGAWGRKIEINDPYGKNQEEMKLILEDLESACNGFTQNLIGGH